MKALLSDDSAFDIYKQKLLGKLQRASLKLGEIDFREDAKLKDIAWITTETGAHVPVKDGKAVGGPLKGMDFENAESSQGKAKKGKNVSETYGSPYPIEEISAEGANKPCTGFTEGGLKRHKESRHKAQYAHMTDEQYQNHAIKMLQKKCGPDILGYRCSDGAICRFNRLTGEFVKGYPGGKVKTCFYPTRLGTDPAKIDVEYANRYFNAMKKEESYD